MSTTKLGLLILAIALALYILLPGLSWGQDAAARFTADRSECGGVSVVSGLDAKYTSSKTLQRRNLNAQEALANQGNRAGAEETLRKLRPGHRTNCAPNYLVGLIAW